MRLRVGGLVGLVVGAFMLAACSGGASGTAETASSTASAAGTSTVSGSASGLPAGWVDEEITYRSGDLTIHGTYRHPASAGGKLPAALLIAGSGPTDRNGNSPGIPGTADSLRAMAGWLAGAGVASLRYDKVGSGATGRGSYGADPSRVTLELFTTESRDGLQFLVSRPDVDAGSLSVYGHSEGGLIALLLATSATGPAVHSIGLVEPLSRRYLDQITEQIQAQLAAQRASGALPAAEAARISAALALAVKQLRDEGTVPADLPGGLGALFGPSALTFLRQADAVDPATLAAKLPHGFPVLLSCSDADIQISCADTDHLAAGLTAADLTYVHLTGVSHVLKQDPSRSVANYGAPLPFSTQLAAAVDSFARR